MKYYIADQHFFDEGAIAMDDRAFSNTDEMNEYMIRQWNLVVRGGDDVYVLGDMFAQKGAESRDINRILHKLKGRICLIEGNHDRGWLKKPGVDLDRFRWIKAQAAVKDGDFECLLNHYPILFFGKNHTKAPSGDLKVCMMHGHVHNTQENKMLVKFLKEAEKTNITTVKGDIEPMKCNLINCFCKYSDYKPLTLEEWKKNEDASP